MVATDKIYVDGSPPAYDASDANGMNNENKNLITSSGQTPNVADNLQTSKAIAIYSSKGDFYQEAGGSAANIYVLEGSDLQNQVFQLKDGMRIRFKVTNQNTGASTVDVNGLGVRNIFYGGSALLSGMLALNDFANLVFDETNDRFNLTYVLESSLLFTDKISGSVGIGTTSPGIVAGFPTTLTVSTLSAEQASSIEIQGNRTTNSPLADLKFINNAVQAGLIRSVRSGSNDSGDLSFSTTIGGVGTEVMFMTKGGNVGIGTSSPAIIGGFTRVVTVSTLGAGEATSLELQGNKTTDNPITDIKFINNGVQVAGIQTIRSGANNSGEMSFTTVNAGSSVENIRMEKSGDVRPGTDGTQDIGTASFRWQDVWATNGTIQTSDKRQKTSVKDSSLGLDFINALRAVEYKFKDYVQKEVVEEVVTTVQKTEKVMEKVTQYDFKEIKGKMIRKEKIVEKEVEQKVFVDHPVFDEKGDPVMVLKYPEKFIINPDGEKIVFKEAVYEQDIYKEPVMIEITETIVRKPSAEHKFNRTHYGLVAQEVETLLDSIGLTTKEFAPLIYDSESDIYGFRYTEMVGILIKAVQELAAKVNT